MKVYFLADTHFGMKGDNEIWLKDCEDYFRKVLIPYFKENVKEDDILVHLGDVFDNRANLGLHTISVVIDLFEDLSKIFNDIRICVGNHDIWQKHSTEITGLKMLKNIEHIKIYFKPEVEVLSGKKVLFVPWIEDVNKQKELLKNHNVDYVFGHLEIGGCVTNSKGNLLKSNNSIQSGDFKKAQVYAGHIHIRQDYKNIHYVGTPYHKDRGDVGNKKGITVLKMESGRTDFIENTFSPQFKSVNVYDLLDTTVGELKEQWKNTYINLYAKNSDILTCKNFETLRVALKDYYKEWKLSGISSQDFVQVEKVIDMEAKSPEDMITYYIDNKLNMSDTIREGVKEMFEKIKGSV